MGHHMISEIFKFALVEEPCLVGGQPSRVPSARMSQMIDLPSTRYTQCTITGWWFGTWLLFSIMHGIILPIDFHIFQDGWSHQPVFISIYSTSSSLNLGSDPNVSRCGAQDLFGLRHAALRPLACRLSVGLHDPGASLWLLGFGEEIRKPYRMVPPSYKLVYKPH